MGPDAPQAVAALLLLSQEAADSVAGLAKPAILQQVSPRALWGVEARAIRWSDGSGQGWILVLPCPAQGWLE